MPATFERDTGNIFRMDISGRLTAADFALLQRSAGTEIERAGKIGSAEPRISDQRTELVELFNN